MSTAAELAALGACLPPWPPGVRVGTRFTTEGARSGNPNIGREVTIVRFDRQRWMNADHAVCVYENGCEYHFYRWQLEGAMLQLRLVFEGAPS